MARAVFERGVPAHAPERRRPQTDGADGRCPTIGAKETPAWLGGTARARGSGAGSLTAIVLIFIAVLAVIYALFLQP